MSCTSRPIAFCYLSLGTIWVGGYYVVAACSQCSAKSDFCTGSAVVYGGGHGDGQLIGEIGSSLLKGEDWKQSPHYEKAVLYQLRPAITYAGVLNAVRPDVTDMTGYRSIDRATHSAGRLALTDGLVRVGLVASNTSSETGLTIPIGAVAAFHFERRDIRQPTDHALHADIRAISIQRATQVIESAVRPDRFQYGANSPASTAAVYTYIGHGVDVPLPRVEVMEVLGFAGMTDEQALWTELRKDLRDIDGFAGSSVFRAVPFSGS